MTDQPRCPRCEVLQDLLDTATSQRDHARDESSKADRETLSLKHKLFEQRYQEVAGDRQLVAYFRSLAQTLGASPEQMLER